MNRNALALALLTLLPTSASAATKTYDVERIYIQILSDITGRGWLFMEDVKGVSSRLSFVVLGDEGEIIYNCHVIRTGRDFNIVNVGTFAQQATAHTTAAFMAGACGTQVTQVDVSCPYQGIPASEAFEHQTITQSGTYRTNNSLVSSYKATGHRDVPDFCVVNVTRPLGIEEFDENLGILTRLSQTHTGDTAYRTFVGDPPGWLTLRDVTYPF